MSMDELIIANNNLVTVNNPNDCSFKINYEQTKHFGANHFVKSPVFVNSGYDWSIRYYPRGSHKAETSAYISLYLDFESDDAENVTANISFQLLGGEDSKPLPFKTANNSIFRHKNSSQGFRAFIRRSLLESEFVKDGFFVVGCCIRVLNEEWERNALVHEVATPPFRHLHDELYEIYKRQEMGDVVVEVGGESVVAHRLILVARSPVFKDVLANSTAGSTPSRVKINDIRAIVFKILLHFMYTDTLPPVQEVDLTEGNVDLYALTQEVLVAASVYKMDGLKRICEEKLTKNVSIDTAASSLDLAHQYDCAHLKEVCLEFVTRPENIVEFMRSDVYVELMHRCPSLLAEYRACEINFPPFKKQRTE